MRRSKQQFWYEIPRIRARFERGIRAAYPKVSITPGFRGRDAKYVLTVDIPELEPREIEIRVEGKYSEPFAVSVLSDSTSKLKHTFGPINEGVDQQERLCIWYPDDPDDRKWVAADGLLALITLARIHLYKEAYFAKYDEWLGDEAPHEPKTETGETSG